MPDPWPAMPASAALRREASAATSSLVTSHLLPPTSDAVRKVWEMPAISDISWVSQLVFLLRRSSSSLLKLVNCKLAPWNCELRSSSWVLRSPKSCHWLETATKFCSSCSVRSMVAETMSSRWTLPSAGAFSPPGSLVGCIPAPDPARGSVFRALSRRSTRDRLSCMFAARSCCSCSSTASACSTCKASAETLARSSASALSSFELALAQGAASTVLASGLSSASSLARKSCICPSSWPLVATSRSSSSKTREAALPLSAA
mmetsp:Transcript_16341/g.29015  ORF Transcript_16341/g.29015 Transcript_16341/m.29015 type:complete len:261 (-) Transcript_16341:1108-1890(-)